MPRPKGKTRANTPNDAGNGTGDESGAPPAALLTSAEIRSLAGRAVELMDGLYDDDGDGDDDDELQREQSKGLDYALETLRFCVNAAGMLADTALADVVIDALERLERYDNHVYGHRVTAAGVLGDLLEAGLEVDDRIAAHARGPQVELRTAIARGLNPHRAPDRALLDALAVDPVRHVRDAAKQSLSNVAEVPWWAGKWATDPEARLRPEDAGAAAALRRAGALLERSPYEILSWKREELMPPLLATLAELPPDLEREAIEHFCRACDPLNLGDAATFLYRMLELDGGIAAFTRRLEGWADTPAARTAVYRLTPVVVAAPPELRSRLCRHLANLVAAAPWEQRSRSTSAACMAGELAGKGWPPGADVVLLLEAVLAGDHEKKSGEWDYARINLAEALTKPEMDPAPVLERLCDARVAGDPGPFKGLRSTVNSLLARAPRDVVRRTAERVLEADRAAKYEEDDVPLRWALAQLLGPVFDPAEDGPPLDRARAVLADPRWRAAVFEDYDLLNRTLPALRSELRAGALPASEAVATLRTIERLHGGVAGTSDEAWRAKVRDEVGAFLGPPELCGPPSAVEWAELRRARAAPSDATIEQRAWTLGDVLAEGPWLPEELAELDGYFEAARAGSERLPYTLARVLAAKPDAALLPRFEELYAMATDEDDREGIKHFRKQTRKALGLPEEPAPNPASDEGEAPENDEGTGDDGDDGDGDGDDAWEDDDDQEEENE